MERDAMATESTEGHGKIHKAKSMIQVVTPAEKLYCMDAGGRTMQEQLPSVIRDIV
jgi:hypothetical protein